MAYCLPGRDGEEAGCPSLLTLSRRGRSCLSSRGEYPEDRLWGRSSERVSLSARSGRSDHSRRAGRSPRSAPENFRVRGIGRSSLSPGNRRPRRGIEDSPRSAFWGRPSERAALSPRSGRSDHSRRAGRSGREPPSNVRGRETAPLSLPDSSRWGRTPAGRSPSVRGVFGKALPLESPDRGREGRSAPSPLGGALFPVVLRGVRNPCPSFSSPPLLRPSGRGGAPSSSRRENRESRFFGRIWGRVPARRSSVS